MHTVCFENLISLAELFFINAVGIKIHIAVIVAVFRDFNLDFDTVFGVEDTEIINIRFIGFLSDGAAVRF